MMTFETRRELSVREDPVGGEVRGQVQEGPPLFAQGRNRLIILVHGFNNSQADARQSYSEFVEMLGKTYEEEGLRALDLLVKFHWPGDVDLRWVSRLTPWASRASYPFEIPDAIESAKRLAGFLRRLHGPGGGWVQLDFVAHSLGCRVLLETLRRLIPDIGEARIKLGEICLMAAAVQVNMVESDGPLSETLSKHRRPRRPLNLYSTRDWVLNIPFRLGQAIAGEGFRPKALGRIGPQARGLKNVKHEEVHELGHGDYWKNRDSAYYVAKLLALGIVPHIILSRPTPTHSLPEFQIP